MSDIVIAEPTSSYLVPAARLEVVLQAYQAKKDFINKVLAEGTDYGPIPGGDKPALKKPGAEKLSSFFGLRPIFEDVQTVEDWMGEQHGGEPFFYYRQRCKLFLGDALSGPLVGTADGSCNSWETKFRYRYSNRKCPNCSRETIIKGKDEYGGGWLCYARKGGCGAKYPDGDQSIESQKLGQVKNTDPAELVNTILKMAQKRALVAAVLIATGASDYFTQDVDDFTEGEFHETAKTEHPKKSNGNGSQKVHPIFQAWIENKVVENAFEAANVNGKYLKLDLDKTALDEAVKIGKLYRNWRDAGQEPAEAAKKTLAGELPK